MKGGLPLTDFFDAVSSGNYPYYSITNRYVIGPAVELGLPFGLGVELDALYRHFSYETPGFRTTTPPIIQLHDGLEDVTGGAWEIPLLAQYRFRTPVVKPYVDAGIAWDVLSGVSGTVCSINCGTTSDPRSLQRSTVKGFVAGAGLDVHLLFLHIAPEIRYTRWGSEHFVSPIGGLSSNQNQAEFLLGILF